MFFVFAEVVLGLATMLFVGLAVRLSRRVRLILETRLSPVRALAPGGVFRVRGKVRAIEATLTAPLTGEVGVFVEHIIDHEKRTTSDRGTHETWTNQARATRGGWCLVDDGTGAVRVDLAAAERELNYDHQSDNVAEGDAPFRAAQKALLAEHKVSEGRLGMHRTLRFTEIVVQEGDEVVVFGRAEDEGDALSLTARGVPLIVTDRSAGALRRRGRSGVAVLVALAVLTAALGGLVVWVHVRVG
jgi:hypothetical protein